TGIAPSSDSDRGRLRSPQGNQLVVSRGLGATQALGPAKTITKVSFELGAVVDLLAKLNTAALRAVTLFPPGNGGFRIGWQNASAANASCHFGLTRVFLSGSECFFHRGLDDPPLSNVHIVGICARRRAETRMLQTTRHSPISELSVWAPLVLAVLRIVSALLLIDQGLITLL